MFAGKIILTQRSTQRTSTEGDLFADKFYVNVPIVIDGSECNVSSIRGQDQLIRHSQCGRGYILSCGAQNQCGKSGIGDLNGDLLASADLFTPI